MANLSLCDSPFLSFCVSQGLALSAIPVSSPDHEEIPACLNVWVYNPEQGPKAHRQRVKSDKKCSIWKVLPKAMFWQWNPAPFPRGEVDLTLLSQGFPTPSRSHICSVLPSLCHTRLATLHCYCKYTHPPIFGSSMAQIPVVNKVLAVCSLLIQP